MANAVFACFDSRQLVAIIVAAVVSVVFITAAAAVVVTAAVVVVVTATAVVTTAAAVVAVMVHSFNMTCSCIACAVIGKETNYIPYFSFSQVSPDTDPSFLRFSPEHRRSAAAAEFAAAHLRSPHAHAARAAAAVAAEAAACAATVASTGRGHPSASFAALWDTLAEFAGGDRSLLSR